jgi:hypothetical protein
MIGPLYGRGAVDGELIMVKSAWRSASTTPRIPPIGCAPDHDHHAAAVLAWAHLTQISAGRALIFARACTRSPLRYDAI